MDDTEIKTEKPDTFESDPADYNVSIDDIKLEYSEIGEPVPFKIIKLKHEDGEPPVFKMDVPVQTKWVADSDQHQPGPSNADQPVNEPQSPPNKRLKTDSSLPAAPPVEQPEHSVQRENNESIDDIKLEYSEIGEPVPFKIIKLEHEDGEPTVFKMEVPVQAKWVAGSDQYQPGPSNADQPVNEPQSPPNKRLKTDTTLSAALLVEQPEHSVQRETNESMEIMSSDDDTISDSDMEYGSDSESDSACEYTSDDDDDSPPGNLQCDDVNVVSRENEPVWTYDESSMLNIKFIKKREFLKPQPKSPYDTFRWLLDDQILDVIINETNKYGNSMLNNKKLTPTSRFRTWKDVTREEMIRFLALLLHTGTIRTKRLADYWKEDYLFNLKCFSRFMTQNRFMLILNCLNFGSRDPNTLEKDNIAKIRPIINHYNKKMNEIYYPGKELIVVKSMVFWHGRLMRQEYTDQRRHRRAVNLFMLAEPNGTVVKFQVYAGNSVDNEFRVQELLEDHLGYGHSVYMDRPYSSYKLALSLLESDTYCTGILNKKTKYNPFRENTHSIYLQNHSYFANGVHIGKWRTTKPILYITTEFKQQFRLIMAKNGAQTCTPKAIANYSRFMTGNELQDQMMMYMPFSRKKLRWYKKVFIYALQIYMSSAFQLFKNYSGIKKRLSYYEYRLAILKAMLPAPDPTPPMDVPPAPRPKYHVLTKITRTKLRERKNKNGTVRIVHEVMRKDCKPCRKGKRRTLTLYECVGCEGSPGYCTTCFCEEHDSTNTPYEMDFDEDAII